MLSLHSGLRVPGKQQEQIHPGDIEVVGEPHPALEGVHPANHCQVTGQSAESGQTIHRVPVDERAFQVTLSGIAWGRRESPEIAKQVKDLLTNSGFDVGYVLCPNTKKFRSSASCLVRFEGNCKVAQALLLLQSPETRPILELQGIGQGYPAVRLTIHLPRTPAYYRENCIVEVPSVAGEHAQAIYDQLSVAVQNMGFAASEMEIFRVEKYKASEAKATVYLSDSSMVDRLVGQQLGPRLAQAVTRRAATGGTAISEPDSIGVLVKRVPEEVEGLSTEEIHAQVVLTLESWLGVLIEHDGKKLRESFYEPRGDHFVSTLDKAKVLGVLFVRVGDVYRQKDIRTCPWCFRAPCTSCG